MLNLLVREDRYVLRKEYMIRVFNIFLVASVFLLVSFMTVLFSKYLYVDSENKISFDEKLKIESALLTVDQKTYNEKVAHLEKEFLLFKDYKNIPSVYYSMISGMKTSGVKLNSIQVEYVGADKKIKISGIAENRNSLIAFSDSLKTSEVFETVDLPFSSFVKDSNIPFAIDIKVKNQDNAK